MKRFEYVIWGIPEGESMEDILYTKAESEEEAEKIMKILENKYNCSNVRLQIIDFEMPITKEDWKNTINKEIK
jgi:hypothetical protein